LVSDWSSDVCSSDLPKVSRRLSNSKYWAVTVVRLRKATIFVRPYLLLSVSNCSLMLPLALPLQIRCA